MMYVPPIVSILIGLLFSISLLGLLLGGAPNSSPQQWATIKAWMLATAIVAVASVIIAIGALIGKRTHLATGVGAAPVIFVIVAFVLLWRSQP